MYHFTSFFLGSKSILLVKRALLLNSAFAIVILDLISYVHLPSFVNMLPKHLKDYQLLYVNKVHVCVSVAQQPNLCLGHLIVDVPRSHTVRNNTFCRTTLDEWSARHRGSYVHSTQQARETTNNHALSGIRSLNPNNGPASDLRPRPCGHQDWLCM
jgi:hypothetical protein